MLSFVRRLLSRIAQTPTPRPQRQPYRPALEVLEERRLLSVAAEFHVNQTVIGDQFDSDNASDRLGRTAIVWTERTSSGDDSNIRLRTFDAGVPGVTDPAFKPNALTNEVLVDASTLDDSQPAVSLARQNGTLVVVWSRTNVDGTRDILGRHFNVNGAALTNTFVIAGTTLDEFEPDVAVSPLTGEFVVSYTVRPVSSSSNLDVLAKRFGPQGVTVLQTIQAAAISSLIEQHSSVAFSQSVFTQLGNFGLGLQESSISDPSNGNIRLKRFNANGSFAGSQLVAATAFREENPSVAGDPNGSFLVSWQRFDGGTSGWNVFTRRVSSIGSLGVLLTIANTTAQEINPSVGVDPVTGNFVVGFQSITGNALRIKVTEFLANNTRRLTVDMGYQVLINFAAFHPNKTIELNIFGPAVSFGGGAYNVSYTKLDDPLDVDLGIFARRGRVN